MKLTDKNKTARSTRALSFLNSNFWIEDLQPWIDNEKIRLSEEYIDYPMEDKFNKDRERAKTRYTACNIVPQIIKRWSKEKAEIKKNKELRIADKAMQGIR